MGGSFELAASFALATAWLPNPLQEMFSEVLLSENSIFTGARSNPTGETLENRCFFSTFGFTTEEPCLYDRGGLRKSKHNGTSLFETFSIVRVQPGSPTPNTFDQVGRSIWPIQK
jgi:hypothetical protein